MDKIKITDKQFLSLTANGSIGGSVIIFSALLASVAKQDAWIGALLTPAIGMPLIWIHCFLGSQYPDMTLVGIIKKICGKWAGFIVAAGFVFFCLTTASRVVWYASSFLNIQAMPETPVYVLNSVFFIAIVIAILYGIETIARASQLFMYSASFLFILAMVFALPNARIENLQPVFEKGIIPILKSSIFVSTLSTFPLVYMMMIYPINLNNIPEAKKSFYKGYLWSSFILFIAVLMAILVLGSGITANLQFPTYFLAKEINVGIIFTRLEFVIAASWLITQVVVGILYFYALVIGFSELLGLKEHKKIVIPLGLIELMLSGIAFPDLLYERNWHTLVWTPYVITYGVVLPVLLLLIFLTKKWVFKRT